jgi:hypothetical protein
MGKGEPVTGVLCILSNFPKGLAVFQKSSEIVSEWRRVSGISEGHSLMQ